MSNYDNTPSFYNNEETYMKYLGFASYYLAFQESIEKLIRLSDAKKVVELGSALGSTTIKLSKIFKDKSFIGYDLREHVVEISNNKVKEDNLPNVKFEVSDMQHFALNKTNADFIYMLFAFHHIEDPLLNKVNFLKNLYKNMKKGAYICIAETFIPDDITLDNENAIVELFARRKKDGYGSTFIKALNSLDDKDISQAHEVGLFCGNNEYLAGEMVARRDNEYLVQSKWLEEICHDIGFKIVLNIELDSISDRVVLIQK